MEVILSKQCLSLTGMLRTDLGYFLVKRGEKFFSQRSKHSVPPDGHLRFIFLCAELAQAKLHITDIKVSGYELAYALEEVKCFTASEQVWRNYVFYDKDTYNADEVLQFKKERDL